MAALGLNRKSLFLTIWMIALSMALTNCSSCSSNSGGMAVTVPNVVGDTQAAATSAITGASLVVGTVTMASSATVAVGNVISQMPVAGTSVAGGSAVSLTVSSGASSDIVTSRYDNARSGVNSNETILTTA